MNVVLLGSGGYHPSDHRQTACVMIPQAGIILDAGTGLYRARRWIQTEYLDILLTHAHLDHVVGLTYLFDVVYGLPITEVRVHAEPDKLRVIEEHLWHPILFPARPPCVLVPLADPIDLPGGARVVHFPLRHPGGVRGFRLDWPTGSMAYVTDTTADPAAPYVAQIQGVDLLIHECYFGDEFAELATKTGHSWTSAVAQVARAASVGRLVLVHVNPLEDSLDPVQLSVARHIFPHTELGTDGMELPLRIGS